MGLLNLGGHALSHLGDHPLSVVGPARRLAQHLGYDDAAEGLQRLNWYKKQAQAREYAQQLQTAPGAGDSDESTSEDDGTSGAPGDEADAVDAPSGSGPDTADDVDGSLLGGIGRAIHGVHDWISDAW